MHAEAVWTLAIFDGGRGFAFTFVLVGMLIAGAVLLVSNLAARQREASAAPPRWEPVASAAPLAQPPASPPPAEPAAGEVVPRGKPAASRAPKRAKPAPVRRRA